MKVFLTGATGYIGSVVAEKLQEAGHSVVGLARSDESARELRDHGYDVQRGDLTDAAALKEAARATHGTIHAAATGGPDQGEVDRQAVDALLEALEGSGKPFVYTDGVWVLGNTGDSAADEETPLDPVDLVAWRPAVVERVLGADLHGVAIRPANVYGRGGSTVAMLVDAGRKHGVVRYIGDGEQQWSFVHVDDVADLYVRALEDAPAGTLLHAAHPPSYSMKTVAEAASHAAGDGVKTESWPLEEAREELGPFADALALDQKVSASRAKSLLGWEPKGPDVLDDLRTGSYT